MVLNTFRMNISILQEVVKDQRNVRMLKASVNNMPPNTYVCWDHYLSLNPF